MPTPLLIQADARSIPLPANSVHCVVTSPPYWGLRSYDLGAHEGTPLGLEKRPDCLGWATGAPCGQCYICHMVEVFREVRRVLRADGVCWVNIGDCYFGGKGANGNSKARLTAGERGYHQNAGTVTMATRPLDMPQEGLKPKDMIGMPWRLALALQADGWWLRSDVIWNKPNAMPESVNDRPTKAHEYVLLLAKSSRYFYDGVAIQEPLADASLKRVAQPDLDAQQGGFKTETYQANHPGRKMRDRRPADIMRATRELAGRNRRTVWSIPTIGYAGAHFAVMPTELARVCILAGTSEHGVCPTCGAPWRRVTERTFQPQADIKDPAKLVRSGGKGMDASNTWSDYRRGTTETFTIAWRPSCTCDAGDPIPATVLDPFSGAGTTLLAARELGRTGIGLDLSASYLAQARRRLYLDRLAAWEGGTGREGEGETVGAWAELPLFGELVTR